MSRAVVTRSNVVVEWRQRSADRAARSGMRELVIASCRIQARWRSAAALSGAVRWIDEGYAMIVDVVAHTPCP